MGSGIGGIAESFPKRCQEILRKEECKEEDRFVWAWIGRESCGTETQFRVERMVCVRYNICKGSVSRKGLTALGMVESPT